MNRTENVFNVYLESGKKRVFAGALGWPGWQRSGREQASALQALLEYGPRYAAVLRRGGLDIQPPTEVSSLRVVERLEGNAATDFGAPSAIPDHDLEAVDSAAMDFLEALLSACWQAFDAAVMAAEGVELVKGPRGGGRDREKIVQHVIEADKAYLRRLGWKFKAEEGASQWDEVEGLREAILEGLEAAARGEVAPEGPRGGARWPPRYFVRRSAWHVLDHAWEIEDRMLT